jgi:hypothetical protein
MQLWRKQGELSLPDRKVRLQRLLQVDFSFISASECGLYDDQILLTWLAPLFQLPPLLRMTQLLLLLALSILRMLLRWSPKRKLMHDLVQRSSLLYGYCILYDAQVWDMTR